MFGPVSLVQGERSGKSGPSMPVCRPRILVCRRCKPHNAGCALVHRPSVVEVTRNVSGYVNSVPTTEASHHDWIPAFLVMVLLAAAGFVFLKIDPLARSIGDIFMR